jgi:hypothetical protein
MAPRDRLEFRDLPSPPKAKEEHNLDVMAALLGKKQESKKKIKTRQMNAKEEKPPIDPRLQKPVNLSEIDKKVHDARPVQAQKKE